MYVNVSGCGFSLHSDIVMPYIEHIGTPEQQEKFIPPMVAGTKIGAIAMTEPSAGRFENFYCVELRSRLMLSQHKIGQYKITFSNQCVHRHTVYRDCVSTD